MAVIGTFVRTKDGGWSGFIRTLLIDAKVRFVPNDKRESDASPAFRVLLGECEIGAAWQKHSMGDTPRTYLSVRLVDPTLPTQLSAALFESDGGGRAQLVWKAQQIG